jgi:hypothetical protein
LTSQDDEEYLIMKNAVILVATPSILEEHHLHIDSRRESQAIISINVEASRALVVITHKTVLFIVTVVRTSNST